MSGYPTVIVAYISEISFLTKMCCMNKICNIDDIVLDYLFKNDVLQIIVTLCLKISVIPCLCWMKLGIANMWLFLIVHYFILPVFSVATFHFASVLIT